MQIIIGSTPAPPPPPAMGGGGERQPYKEFQKGFDAENRVRESSREGRGGQGRTFPRSKATKIPADIKTLDAQARLSKTFFFFFIYSSWLQRGAEMPRVLFFDLLG